MRWSRTSSAASPTSNRRAVRKGCSVYGDLRVRSMVGVARYILRERGRRGQTPSGRTLSTVKLQKLVYYSQAWHLVWEDRPLFPERIEAWANGPVVPDLYREHRGDFELTSWKTRVYSEPQQLRAGKHRLGPCLLRSEGRVVPE